MKYLSQLVLAISWVVGVFLAKGFWSTFFAIVLPIWAWYLDIEWAFKFLQLPSY